MSRWRSVRIVLWSLVVVAGIGAAALMTGIIQSPERAMLQELSLIHI